MVGGVPQNWWNGNQFMMPELPQQRGQQLVPAVLKNVPYPNQQGALAPAVQAGLPGLGGPSMPQNLFAGLPAPFQGGATTPSTLASAMGSFSPEQQMYARALLGQMGGGDYSGQLGGGTGQAPGGISSGTANSFGDFGRALGTGLGMIGSPALGMAALAGNMAMGRNQPNMGLLGLLGLGGGSVGNPGGVGPGMSGPGDTGNNGIGGGGFGGMGDGTGGDNGGPAPGFRTGGQVQQTGPAMVHQGEYYERPEAVRKYGTGLFAAFNSGRIDPRRAKQLLR